MGRPRHLKHTREALKYARSCGFADAWIDYNRTHPILHGTVNGIAVGLVFPGTPSDQRGMRNMRAAIRRLARGGRP